MSRILEAVSIADLERNMPVIADITDMVNREFARVAAAREAEIRRLLGMWVSELEPRAIWAHHDPNLLLGLGITDSDGRGLMVLRANTEGE